MQQLIRVQQRIVQLDRAYGGKGTIAGFTFMDFEGLTSFLTFRVLIWSSYISAHNVYTSERYSWFGPPLFSHCSLAPGHTMANPATSLTVFCGVHYALCFSHTSV